MRDIRCKVYEMHCVVHVSSLQFHYGLFVRYWKCIRISLITKYYCNIAGVNMLLALFYILI